MSNLYQSVVSCLQKGSKPAEEKPKEEEKKTEDEEKTETTGAEDEIKENDAPELSSDKKTDEIVEPKQQPGILWRVTSGVVGTTSGAVTGAVGLGVGGVKWAAGKSYDVGSAVYSKVPSISSLKRKDKKE